MLGRRPGGEKVQKISRESKTSAQVTKTAQPARDDPARQDMGAGGTVQGAVPAGRIRSGGREEQPSAHPAPGADDLAGLTIYAAR